MSRSAVELDFFRMEKEAEAKPQPSKLFDRRRSFRDIQGVISKLDPGLLKTVIKSGTVDLNSITSKSTENGGSLFSRGSFSVPSTPTQGANLFPALPLLVPALGSNTCGFESGPETTPLTIFYNGTVSVFHVSPHKAESIMKFAREECSRTVESGNPKRAVTSSDQNQLLDNLDGDLPIARRKSLLRFLEKRRERLTTPSPYGSPINHAVLGHKPSEHRD